MTYPPTPEMKRRAHEAWLAGITTSESLGLVRFVMEKEPDVPSGSEPTTDDLDSFAATPEWIEDLKEEDPTIIPEPVVLIAEDTDE